MKNEIDDLREKLFKESMECGYLSYLDGWIGLGFESEDSPIYRSARFLDIASLEELQNAYNEMKLYKKKEEERIRTEKELNKQKRKISFIESSNEASVIDPYIFMEYCKNLISYIKEKSMNYISCTVPVYCPNDHIYIVILFKNNEVFKFGSTSNLPQWITNHKKYVDIENLSSYSLGYTLCYDSDLMIKDIIASINIITNLKSATIYNNSKIFIDHKKLYNYMDIVHNLSTPMVKRFLKNNPDITTYVNMGNIVYLKQEIDSRVIRDAKLGLFRK